MKNLKNSTIRVKNHIARYKVQYAIVGTSTVFLTIMNRNGNEWKEFLVSKGIDPLEFFCPEAFLEQ
jgi:hypothetical protein